MEQIYEIVFNNDLTFGDLCFRGQADASWKIWPSIFRHYERYQALFHENFIMKHIQEGFRAPYLFNFDPMEQLMILQHFSVPTRLLDWSNDILVALFFACENPDVDGALYFLDKRQFKMYQFANKNNLALRDPLSPANQAYYESRLENSELMVVCSYIGSPRMRAQSVCFLLWTRTGLNDNKYSFDLESYVTTKKMHAPKKLLIAKEAKKGILQILKNHFGIDSSSLYVSNENIRVAEYVYAELHRVAGHNTIYVTGDPRPEFLIPDPGL